MVVYNLAVVLILGAAGVGSGRVGIALWPAVVLHTAMAAWCIMSVRRLSGTEEADNLHQYRSRNEL